jgi:hypothetical protein
MNPLGPRVRVSRVEALKDFIVRVSFDNGTQRDIDLEPYLRGDIFEQLRRNPAAFREMKIEGGTIAWDNGADIDPDVLYYNLTPAWAETKSLQVAEKKAKYGK